MASFPLPTTVMAGCMGAFLFGTNLRADELSPSRSLVSEALRAELDGDNETRRQALRQALRESPEAAAAHWHSGEVQVDGGEWVSFRAGPFLPDQVLTEYRRRRSEAGESVAKLLALADWCQEAGLSSVERAHLGQILAIDPDHAVARERLGHINFDGLWISQEDMKRAAERQREIADSLQVWGPTIREGLELLAGTPYQRDQGTDKLMDIHDPAAIPAMERLLMSGNPEHGLLLIQWLSRFHRYEASQAMARAALATPHKQVQRAAAEALKERPLDEYVPILLGAMRTPVTVRSKIGLNSDGWIVLDMLFEAEAQNEHRQLSRSAEVGTQVVIRRGAGRKPADLGDILTAGRFLLDQQRQSERAQLQWNEVIRRTNTRAESILRSTTRNAELQGPGDWWEWWTRHNELYVRDVKPSLRVQQEPERVYITDRRKQVTDKRPPPIYQSIDGRTSSCFVAGTPVWTDAGAIPIELIQIGDRVLSQNVDTGELAYQPVLQTTVRPPAPTIRVSTDDVSFRATRGHPFWVNGVGWRFIRELEPGMGLHATSGAQVVRAIAPADEAEAYNLVVADFHTYFVSDALILSHDNTPRAPTNSLVPGLSRDP